jgi:hypothetical protein
MRFYVSWIHDLLPIMWRIPPERPLWIGLHSTSTDGCIGQARDGERFFFNKKSKNRSKERGRKQWRRVRFQSLSERIDFTCSMISVSLVSSVLQYVMWHPQKYTNVQLVDDLLVQIYEQKSTLSWDMHYLIPI